MVLNINNKIFIVSIEILVKLIIISIYLFCLSKYLYYKNFY